MSTAEQLRATSDKIVQKKKQQDETEKTNRIQSIITNFKTRVNTLQNDGTLKAVSKKGNYEQAILTEHTCGNFYDVVQQMKGKYNGFNVIYGYNDENKCVLSINWEK